MKTSNRSKRVKIISVTAGVMIVMTLTSTHSLRAGTWTQKADMPTARNFLHTNVVNGKIYAIGAIQPAGLLSTVEAYDPVTDTWTKKADMPTARTFIDSSVVDGKIYVMGGEAYWYGPLLATVEAYDPVTDAWTRRADMPAPRTAFFTGVVNGKIYAIGGSYSSDGVGREVSTVDMYDPATDTWTKKADMPTARAIPNVSVVNGKIYVFGGQTENGPHAAYSTVEVYDPATDTWSRRGDMPWPRVQSGSIVLHDMIYCFGGRTTKLGVPFSTVLQYDPAIDVWTDKGNMPAINALMGVSTVEGKIYLIGGAPSFSIGDMLSTVWEYSPLPDFDFNGDGVVDARDMSMMVDHWHTDASRYDLAPAPGGDGIVDVQDLIALSEQLFEDSRLTVHWNLDEAEGEVAYDSIGENDAVLVGGATWMPDSGQVDGALQFDGEDDYVDTLFALDPSMSTFSVFAWIKGGAAGQVIFSQSQGMNWLALEIESGFLQTELTHIERGKPGPSLKSQSVIDDGGWHRIGFVWDGADRILYVDDVEVARDESVGLAPSEGNLVIGAGAGLQDGSFFSGLIDDVRFYDQAISP